MTEPEGLVPRSIGAFERWLVRINAAVVVGMMASMAILVFVNVVCRYVFSFSLVWAEEISQYLMVWVAFLGAGLAFRQGRHVAVELLQQSFGDKKRVVLRAGIGLACLVFMLALTWLGAEFAWFARDMETPVLNIPLAIPYSAVPIGAALMALHLGFVLRDYAHGRFEIPDDLEPAAGEEAL
jgi:TRAP-type C4-dicarboxylate transport system permease small subunit